MLLGYTATEVLALVPATPGGLRFVVAGLVGTLGLAAVAAADALAETLQNRIVAFWLHSPGGIAYVVSGDATAAAGRSVSRRLADNSLELGQLKGVEDPPAHLERIVDRLLPGA